VNPIASILAQSSLASASEAAHALRSGWTLSEIHAVDASDLLAIYRRRHDHLRSMASPHAVQLADAVAELLPSLESRAIVKICTLGGPVSTSSSSFFRTTKVSFWGA